MSIMLVSPIRFSKDLFWMGE